MEICLHPELYIVKYFETCVSYFFYYTHKSQNNQTREKKNWQLSIVFSLLSIPNSLLNSFASPSLSCFLFFFFWTFFIQQFQTDQTVLTQLSVQSIPVYGLLSLKLVVMSYYLFIDLTSILILGGFWLRTWKLKP